MKKKRLFLLVLTLAVHILPLAAQAETGIFAPFVTRMQGEIRNNLIRLSWVDSLDARGPVYLYRSVTPFGANVSLPGGIEVPYGLQSFVDEVEGGTTYYYFAAASDETGKRYTISIPYSNTIAVRTGESGFSAGIPESPPSGSSSDLPMGISSLEAAVRGDRVVISFMQGGAGSAALYRSVRPIRQMPDLLGAVIVQTRISSPFIDYPVPGIPYYYAVITEEDLTQGTVSITPGRNATSVPVEVSSAGPEAANRDVRAMPLPQISVQAAVPGMNAYSSAPPAMELSAQAAKALGSIQSGPAAPPSLKNARVFARDLEEIPVGGDDYTLSAIIKGPFSSKNWEAARDELVRFLALPRFPETGSRARFYLGQCWYFLKYPREGLFEFLAIQGRYPAESMEWIQASLDMMKNQ